ncbi:MAG: HsdR family type I site-specific deoxyribonuclease [Saprospiraceae bacterium]
MKFNEETLEQAIIELFEAENYQHVSGFHIHKEMSDVLLRDDLKAFLRNRYKQEEITENEIGSVIRSLDILPSSALYDSNKTIMKMISDGFLLKREDRKKKDLFIQLIDYSIIKKAHDFERSENLNIAADPIQSYSLSSDNIFKIVNQLEIQGFEKRIPDGIVYINGLPLVVLEFKSSIKENCTIRDAYTQLATRYRRDIPELFKYNALCVISDGANSKAGSLFSQYDFFYSWRKVEGNEPVEQAGFNSLYTMIKGLFDQERLLDVIKHFVYFPDTSSKEEKIVPRYPQYYATNKLFNSVIRNMKPEGSGKGGTYFGATGCGKSFIMLYLTRMLMRSLHFQSPTIVLITDRTDLDDQLSGQFTNAKDFIGDDLVVSVESRAELKSYLQGRKSGGVFLTTIHKFTEDTDLLTDRSNVICISDEAHRSQVNIEQKVKITSKGVEKTYGFAKHLHDSLPNATYVGFTGTPIDATYNVFGEVADSYTMTESVFDEITVKIIYEGRAAKVILNEERLREIEKYYQKCAELGTNEHQIEESKKAMTRIEEILGDPDILKEIASDFIEHYEKRIEEGATVKGKVMFVAPSRPIAFSLYKLIVELRPQWAEVRECDEGVELSEADRRELMPIEKIKMVMTRDANDPKELFDLLGTKEDRKKLDRQFKNEKSNFKIAMVVDMWLTGFDVPFLDTMYLYKPVQLHSLIQTISRVNRKYEGKEMGLVVDYIGIKSSMNLALKKYGVVQEENFNGIEKAVNIVKDQLDLLAKILHGFDNRLYFEGTPLQQLHCLNMAVEFVQQTDDRQKRFMNIAKKLRSAFSLSCSSEEITQTERDYIHYYSAIKSIIHKISTGEAPDTSQMNEHVRKLIQEALISEGIEEIIKIDDSNPKQSLNIFSDEYLAKIEKIKLPNIKIKLLQKLLSKAIEEFKKTNRIQGVDFSKRLKKLVDLYNERKEFQAFQSDVLDDVAGQFADLFKDLVKERNSFVELGIDFEEKSFYDILKAIAEKYQFEYPHDKLIELSKAVKQIVDDKAKYTDWAQKEDIKAELKVDLILTLAEHGYPPVPKDEVFKEIFEQAENFKKYS